MPEPTHTLSPGLKKAASPSTAGSPSGRVLKGEKSEAENVIEVYGQGPFTPTWVNPDDDPAHSKRNVRMMRPAK